MIISKRYAQKLIKKGRARIVGEMNDGQFWGDAVGIIYTIINRYDKQRTDHYIN